MYVGYMLLVKDLTSADSILQILTTPPHPDLPSAV